MLFRKVQFPKDFPRRARKYDHASYKCHEFRQMTMFLFPLILECLEIEKFREKSVFLSYAFLVRAFRLPDEEFELVSQNNIDEAVNILVHSYEGAFGQTACTYNYHHVVSHLSKYREKGPFTEFSAYGYEGTYATVRRSFCPGTRKYI